MSDDYGSVDAQHGCAANVFVIEPVDIGVRQAALAGDFVETLRLFEDGVSDEAVADDDIGSERASDEVFKIVVKLNAAKGLVDPELQETLFEGENIA